MNNTDSTAKRDEEEDKKKLFLKVLKQAGITRVKVTFNGGGDSGQIEDITADGLLEELELRDIPIPPEGLPLMADSHNHMYGFIETFAYDLLEHESPCDWVNNDGGYGDIIITPETGSIHLDMNERYTDSTLHQDELGFYEEPAEVVPSEVTNG